MNRSLCLSLMTMFLSSVLYAQVGPPRIISNHSRLNGTPSDSTMLGFRTGNGNGGDGIALDLRTVKCDTLHYLTYKNGYYTPSQTIYYSYNANNDVDTMLVKAVAATDKMLVNTYSVANELTAATTYEYDGQWTPASRILKTYAAGNLVVMENQRWDGVSVGWLPLSKRSYTYMGSTLAVDTNSAYNATLAQWGVVQYAKYIYDGAGNNDTIVYMNQVSPGVYELAARQIQMFNGANHAVNTTLYYYTAGVISYGNQMRVVYNANNKAADSTFSYDKNTGTFLQLSANRYGYDVAGRVDTLYSYKADNATPGDPLIPQSQVQYQYNGFKQILKRTSYRWDVVTNSWDPNVWMDVDYYYTAPASIGAIAAPGIDVSLYPNPANDFITLKLDNKQSSIIAIYNTTGALLRQWEEKAGSTTRTIPLHGFENGNYILTVRGADGSKVSRQFVVGK